jgi:hypothetical protein
MQIQSQIMTSALYVYLIQESKWNSPFPMFHHQVEGHLLVKRDQEIIGSYKTRRGSGSQFHIFLTVFNE